MTDDDILWLHYHVPKTGGQTMRRVLADHLGLGRRLAHLTPGNGTFPQTNDQLEMMSEVERSRLRAVVGHDVDATTRSMFAHRDVREIVVIRDNAERIASLYNFRMGQRERQGKEGVPFDAWYEGITRNHMVVFLANHLGVEPEPKAVARRLERCAFVGRTEQMDHWLPHLLKLMSVDAGTPERANVSGLSHRRHLELTDELRERLDADNAADVELIELVQPLVDRHFERIMSSEPTVIGPGGSVRSAAAAPAPTGYIRRLTSPRGRRALQVIAIAGWVALTALALTTRSAWAIASSAAWSGAVALVALKLGLIATVSGQVTPVAAPPARSDGTGPTVDDLVDVAHAHREITRSVIESQHETVERLERRLASLHRRVDPLVTLNEVHYQEIVGLRERLARERAVDATTEDGVTP